MLVFFKIVDGETFYFCGRDSEFNSVLSVFIDDAMHFNECNYEFFVSMKDDVFSPMWG